MTADRLNEAARVLRERAEPDDSPLALALADWLDSTAHDVEHVHDPIYNLTSTTVSRAHKVADTTLGGAVMSLSEERLAEIKERYNLAVHGRTDVPFLLSEVDRLRAGIEALAENWRREWCNERDSQAGVYDPATIEAIREDLTNLLNPTEGEDR